MERRNPSADANAQSMNRAKLPNVAVASGRSANEVRKNRLKFAGTLPPDTSFTPHSPRGETPQPLSAFRFPRIAPCHAPPTVFVLVTHLQKL
jgi:hypothetical protein